MRTSAVGGAIAGLTAVFLASAIGLAYMFGLTPGIVSVESGPHMPDAPAREPVRNVTVPITVTAEDFHLSPNALSMSQPGLITITLANKDNVGHTISIKGVDGTLKVPAPGKRNDVIPIGQAGYLRDHLFNPQPCGVGHVRHPHRRGTTSRRHPEPLGLIVPLGQIS